MTVIAQDDHLTAGAWAACGLFCFSNHSHTWLILTQMVHIFKCEYLFTFA